MLQMKELCALGLPAVWGLGCSSCVGALECSLESGEMASMCLLLYFCPCPVCLVLPWLGWAVMGRKTQLGSEPFGAHFGTLSSVPRVGEAQLGFNISICTWRV